MDIMCSVENLLSKNEKRPDRPSKDICGGYQKPQSCINT